jgi:uncharacterized protein
VAFYIDTSALVKLVVGETETVALRSWLQEADRDLVACDLARTELMRSVRRVVPDRALPARSVLDAVTLVDVTAAVFEVAGRLDPVGLRSLDAIHLASALWSTAFRGSGLVVSSAWRCVGGASAGGCRV